MSDDLKQKKEDLLRKLLISQPEMGMKEANALIRDKFDTGVSPPIFSKIKKECEDGSVATAAKPEAEIASKKKSSKTEIPEVKAEKTAKAEKVTKALKAKKTAPVIEVSKTVPPSIESFLGADSSSEDKNDIASMSDIFDGQEAQKARHVVPEAPSQENQPLISASEEEQNGDSDNNAENDSDNDDDQNNEAGHVQLKEEEPEIDPNLPKFRVQLEIKVPEAQEVHLSGSFNRWRVGEHPLTKISDQVWRFDGELPQGEYQYKFVLDKKIWFLDMNRERVIDKTGVSHSISIQEAAVS
jgi:hypothetical protein